MADEDEIQWRMMTNVSVSQSNGSCCIHQTTVTTILIETYPADHQKLTAWIAEAQREIGGDYNSVTAQVRAIEAVVAEVKRIDAAMLREKNRVEKLEKELAELKRELRGTTPLLTVAGALLPNGIRSKLRCARDLLNAILGDSSSST